MQVILPPKPYGARLVADTVGAIEPYHAERMRIVKNDEGEDAN